MLDMLVQTLQPSPLPMVLAHRLPLVLTLLLLSSVALFHYRGSFLQSTHPPLRTMSPSYSQIVVTGDSISQQAFKIGGYGAALVDAVSLTY